jgi:HD-GYP domain-containing protein (c-di-GMP phosphodiesterase class II)
MDNKEGLCHAIREEGLLVSLLDGELPPTEEHRLLTHLRTCHECLGLTADLLYTDSRLKELFARQEDQKDKQKKNATGRFMLEVDKLPIGKSLDRDLLDDNGSLLVAAGTELTQKLIEGLKRRGIDKLAIESAELVEEEKPKDQQAPVVSYRQISKSLAQSGIEPAVSEFVRQQCLETISSSFRDLEDNGVLDLAEVHKVADRVTEEILSSPQVAMTLADLILADPGLHAHSVNVLILFLMIARAMGHPAQLIRDHAAAVLIHDVGRIVLRRTAQVSQSENNPEDEDSGHTEAGYAYLWNMGGFNESALKMVMNHHERYDGKGYPRAIKGTKLTDWDQILILANTYDLLTLDKTTGLRSGFHEALGTIIQDGSRFARKGIIRAVIQTFGHYPPGSWIKMNNGEIGMVTKAYPGSPLKPQVSILFESSGKKHPRPRFIDLMHTQNVYIVGPANVETRS